MRNFANSLILPFQGATGAQAITAHKKSNQPPQAVSLDIPWRAYALQMNIGGGVTTFNGAVSIDLARGTVSNPLDIVKSVFIDNTSVDRPVYLRCEDTGQIVTCADGSFGWYPLLTFGEQFTLFTDNIIPLRDANQRTKIIFSNASFDTFSGGELNRAQSLVRASGTSSFITPVIADKLSVVDYTNLFQTPARSDYTLIVAKPNSQIVLTSLSVDLSSTGDNIACNFVVKSGGYTLFDINTATIVGTMQIIDLKNLQLTLDGTVPLIFSWLYGLANASTNRTRGKVITQYAQIDLPALSA